MKAKGMAGHLIRRLQQQSTQVFTRHMTAQGLDLTSVQFAAMDALAAEPGIDQATLAARIAYDRATIGGVVDRLEHKGLIAREVSKTDRRARVVTLTDAGAALYARILPVVTALQTEILQGLSPEETANFLALAAKAIEKDDDQQEGPP